MMVSRWLSAAAIAVILGSTVGVQSARATGAPFDNYQFQALIDSDSDNTTGCDVPAEDDNFPGPVEGIEYRVTAFVERFPASAFVDAVIVEKCEGMSFAAPVNVDVAGWDVGLDNGTGSADVVEFRVPRSAIGNPSVVTLAFHATRIFLNDVLLTTNGQENGDPIVFQLSSATGAPVLSTSGLALCTVLLAVIGWRTTRHRRPAVLAVAISVSVATLLTAVWAATIMTDGNVTDWAGIPAIATDVLNDSTADDPGEDIAAAFVTADAQNLYFRMDQVNLAPVVCKNGSLEAGEECENDEHCLSVQHCTMLCDCEDD